MKLIKCPVCRTVFARDCEERRHILKHGQCLECEAYDDMKAKEQAIKDDEARMNAEYTSNQRYY